jgi:hypothetical protein
MIRLPELGEHWGRCTYQGIVLVTKVCVLSL